MKPEAQKFLLDLLKRNNQAFLGSTGTVEGFTSADLDMRKLSARDLHLALKFEKEGELIAVVDTSGLPQEVSIGLKYDKIFIDEALEFDVEAFKYFHVARKSGTNPWITSMVGLEFMSKNGLIEELIMAEKEENYERCAEIMKCAASKGWELRKESHD
jgi:hypothetical protein